MLRSMFAAFALAGVVASAGWAAQTDEAPAAPSAAESAQAEADLKPGQERVKVRCRDEVTTGTRFAKRKCRRMDDLARAEEDARETMLEIIRRPQLPPPTN
jgi:head-tail adaptor